VPRRNPEIAVVVLQEHGDWGSGSAKLAAQIITAYVNKKRRQENNLLQATKPAAPVEMGAVWSVPEPEGRLHRRASGAVAPSAGQPGMTQVTGMSGGRFEIAADTQAPMADPPMFPELGSVRGLVRSSEAKASVDSGGFMYGLKPVPSTSEKPGAPAKRDRAATETGIGLPARFRGVIR
jgi:penicillin-binding protein 2